MPAWQAKWVARVLSGRAPPLPDCATLQAEAAAFYALLERAGVPVRYTHRQARVAHTAACMPDLVHNLHAAAGAGTAASMIMLMGACGMHVGAAQCMGAAGLCAACCAAGTTPECMDACSTHWVSLTSAHNIDSPASKCD